MKKIRRTALHDGQRAQWIRKNRRLTISILAAAFVGVIATISLRAAGPFISIEAEQGNRSGAIKEISDGTASGGKAVQFSEGGNSNIARPNWSDEFDGTSLSYATDNGGGTWRTKGYEAGSVNNGYSDYAGRSWNGNRQQLEQYGLVTVANSTLTMRAMRNPGIPGVNNAWVGAYLVSNHVNNLTWRYGYFEWRASLPTPGRGMFPALWMFNNVPNRNDGYQSAEIDVFEVFGHRTGVPWDITLHLKPKGVNGLVQSQIATVYNDTAGWHRYGVNWTADAITFYKDGQVVSTVTGDRAAWYRNANLGLRMDYVMDPNWPGVPQAQLSTSNDPPIGTKLEMKIDYVRYYSQRPGNLPTGSADPYN